MSHFLGQILFLLSRHAGGEAAFVADQIALERDECGSSFQKMCRNTLEKYVILRIYKLTKEGDSCESIGRSHDSR